MTKERKLWTPAEVSVLVDRYPHEATAVIAADLSRSLCSVNFQAKKFGLKKSDAYLKSPAACRLRRGDNPGIAYRFPKGHVPANKGLRRPGWSPGRMSETQFKPGQRGSRWMPIGATRVIDGYLYTKVNDIRSTKAGPGFIPYSVNWKPTHVLLWEKDRGAIPKGHALKFINGCRTDIRIENISCISRRELMARNTVHNLPKPLADAIQLLGALKRRIRKATKDHDAKQDRTPA